MPTRFFRAGVGTVIYNEDGQVAFFERAQEPVGVWQFQQGGIDLDENPNDTLWRELMEEVGLSRDDIECVTELPGWLPYEDLLASTDPSVPRIGQIHRWFFLKLNVKSTIDLAKATDDEFKAWKWIAFENIISVPHKFKQHVYQKLYDFFKLEILK